MVPIHLGRWPTLGSSERCKDEFIAVNFKLFGCERPEDGEQPKRVGARKGKIYVLLFNKTNRRTTFQIYTGKKLYVFRVVPLLIIRS